jgi:hypothetical protein
MCLSDFKVSGRTIVVSAQILHFFLSAMIGEKRPGRGIGQANRGGFDQASWGQFSKVQRSGRPKQGTV